jgi:mannose-1-phosphate guanylyltransferase
MRAAIIMAGGSGERFWPASTREKPKQLLVLTADGRPLLDLAVDRAAAIAGDNVWLATLPHLTQGSLEASSRLSADKVLTEPDKRNTAGCLLWAAARFMADHPDDWESITWAVLTADQRIEPLSGFQKTVDTAIRLAETHGALVTIGIRPDRPETGFGYIEIGEDVDGGHRVHQFREKPDLATATEYMNSGRFLWNSGMFFWTLGAFARELEAAQPAMRVSLTQIADALKRKDEAGAIAAFRTLPDISIDFAVMEKAQNVMVVAADFDWDDLGSWPALSRTLGEDETGSTTQGEVEMIDTKNCVVAAQTNQKIHLLGVEDLIVVATETSILICPRDRAQDIKIFAKQKPK